MRDGATTEIIEKDLSYRLVGLFFRIQQRLGRYCREQQYGDALENELRNEQLQFVREFPIEVEGRVSNIVDFNIEDRILIDLKAKPFVEKSDYYQMRRYLESANIKLGLIVNFRHRYLQPKRVLSPKYSRHLPALVNSHHSQRFVDSHRGFSLLEVLLVVAVLAILGVAGVASYRNYVKSAELDAAANVIVTDLKSAQAKSMAGETAATRWGIRFWNATDDYYELFSTSVSGGYSVGSVKEKKYLPGSVTFTNPTEGSQTDIIFNRVQGSVASAATVTITSSGQTKTITVTTIGSIY